MKPKKLVESDAQAWDRFIAAKELAKQEYGKAYSKDGERGAVLAIILMLAFPAMLAGFGVPGFLALLGTPVGFFVAIFYFDKKSSDHADAERRARDFDFMSFEEWRRKNPPVFVASVVKPLKKTGLVDEFFDQEFWDQAAKVEKNRLAREAFSGGPAPQAATVRQDEGRKPSLSAEKVGGSAPRDTPRSDSKAADIGLRIDVESHNSGQLSAPFDAQPSRPRTLSSLSGQTQSKNTELLVVAITDIKKSISVIVEFELNGRRQQDTVLWEECLKEVRGVKGSAELLYRSARAKFLVEKNKFLIGTRSDGVGLIDMMDSSFCDSGAQAKSLAYNS
jgi:hypothetical protein